MKQIFLGLLMVPCLAFGMESESTGINSDSNVMSMHKYISKGATRIGRCLYKTMHPKKELDKNKDLIDYINSAYVTGMDLKARRHALREGERYLENKFCSVPKPKYFIRDILSSLLAIPYAEKKTQAVGKSYGKHVVNTVQACFVTALTGLPIIQTLPMVAIKPKQESKDFGLRNLDNE